MALNTYEPFISLVINQYNVILRYTSFKKATFDILTLIETDVVLYGSILDWTYCGFSDKNMFIPMTMYFNNDKCVTMFISRVSKMYNIYVKTNINKRFV